MFKRLICKVDEDKTFNAIKRSPTRENIVHIVKIIQITSLKKHILIVKTELFNSAVLFIKYDTGSFVSVFAIT